MNPKVSLRESVERQAQYESGRVKAGKPDQLKKPIIESAEQDRLKKMTTKLARS